MIFIIIWLPILILITFLLYPKKLIRSSEYYIKYKNNGTLFFSVGLMFLLSLAVSFFVVHASAKVQTNMYGGAALFGSWLILVAPFLFILGFSFLLRGVKFLVEAREIKKIG